MKRGILPKPGIPKPILHGLRRTYTVRHRETFRTMYALDAPRRTPFGVCLHCMVWIATFVDRSRYRPVPARTGPGTSTYSACRRSAHAALCMPPPSPPPSPLGSDPPRCRSVSLCLSLSLCLSVSLRRSVSLSSSSSLSLETLATATRDPRRSSITSPPAPAANLAPLAPLAPLECC